MPMSLDEFETLVDLIEQIVAYDSLISEHPADIPRRERLLRDKKTTVAQAREELVL